VCLKLQSDGKAILQNPPGEILRREHIVHRRKENRCGTVGQPVPDEHATRVLVVGTIANDEFDLVLRCQQLEILPVHPGCLAAAGTFHVDDPDDAGWHVPDAHVTACFQHHRTSRLKQLLHQRVNVALKERLAARNFNQVAAVLLHLRHDRSDAHLRPFSEGIRRVAPGTPEVARREADEHAGPPRVGRLPLDGMEDFINREHFPHCTWTRKTGRRGG
jgi:hypothetical protein